MFSVQKMIPHSLGLAVFLVGGAAHAEIVTYEFTATIRWDIDPNDELSVGTDPGQENIVSGTFSYDTTKPAYSPSNYATNETSNYHTGDISSDQIADIGGNPDANVVFVRDWYTSSNDMFQVTDYADALEGLSNGYQRISIWGGDVFSGDALPTTLSLDDFSGSEYYVEGYDSSGRRHYLIGRITGLTKLEASSVPELSANGMATSLSLLAGSALLFSSRRRHGAISQG